MLVGIDLSEHRFKIFLGLQLRVITVLFFQCYVQYTVHSTMWLHSIAIPMYHLQNSTTHKPYNVEEKKNIYKINI